MDSVISAINDMRLNLARDIDARLQAETSLKEHEKLLSEIIEGTSDAIFIKDIMGRYILANEATAIAVGKPKEKIIGKTDQEIFPQISAEIIDEVDSSVIKSGKPLVAEEKLETSFGDSYWLTNKSPRFDNNGNIIGLIGISRNITDQKKAEAEKALLEERLKLSQKMESIGNLAGGIAHDFNNILSSIIGYTEIALDDVEKGTIQEDNLQEVYTAGKRARDLVKQILAFARQSDEERKPIRVDTIAREVVKLIRSTIPTTIEIKENVESHSLIMGNPSQVHQLFMNLCTNAAQAMEDTGGILEVGLTDVELDDQSSLPHSELISGNYMKVTISDNGPGISPNIIDSIFDPYFTTKGVGEGTGMGLALAHGIVKSYSGEITVDSKLGKGTVFSIYLPITKKREVFRPYNQEKLPSGTESILFVDDELPIAKMNSQILERLGYRVTVCTSSIEALELFSSKPNEFDLVISDITMPNMTGDELAMELIALRSDLPVILYTGYSKKITDEKAEKIGVKAFAYKPIVKADLAKTVRKVLDEARSTAQG